MRLAVAITSASALLLTACTGSASNETTPAASSSASHTVVSAPATAQPTPETPASKFPALIAWESIRTSHNSVLITVDDEKPCVAGYKATVTGFTPLKNTRISIEWNGQLYGKPEVKANDEKGTITFWIACTYPKQGIFILTLTDEETNRWAQTGFGAL